MKNAFHSVGLIVLPAVIVVSILFFLPLTPNYFATVKILAVILAVASLLVSWAVSSFSHQEMKSHSSRLMVPLVLLALVLGLNLISNKEGWLESLTGRGALYGGSIVLALLAGSLARSEKLVSRVVYAFIGSTSALAVFSLIHLTYLYTVNSLPAFMASRSFTPTGSTVTSFVLLLIGAVVTYVLGVKNLKGNAQYIAFVFATIQTIAAVAYLSLMLPGGELNPNLLPYQTSWAVTLDALKSPRSLLLGTGLANFGQLYTQVKPLSVNLTGLWNSYPTTASSEVLQVLATSGILGFAMLILVVLTVLTHRTRGGALSQILFLTFILSAVSLIFTPASVPVMIIFFLSAVLSTAGDEKSIHASPAVVNALSAGAVILALGITYFYGRAYVAERHMFLASKALAAQDGRKVYEENIAAIRLMPALANYHLSYSQVNLSLASALSQKNELSEDDRKQVSALVQQGIREAKTAATLRPHDTQAWQNMGTVYRNLINVADGADQFAVAAYAQAVALDPASPALRVEYGGLMYQLAGLAKDKDTKMALLNRAVQEFQTAVQLKNDYANGYYNLSKAFESAGNNTAAYAAMQKVIASLAPDSPDVGKATSDLEALKAKLPKASPTPSASPAPSPASSELSQPSPLPSPAASPLELPETSPLPTPSP